MAFKIILISFLSSSNMSFSIGYSAFGYEVLGDGFLFVFNIDKKIKKTNFVGVDMGIYKSIHHSSIFIYPASYVHMEKKKENLFCLFSGLNLCMGKENNFRIGIRGMNILIDIYNKNYTYYKFCPLIYISFHNPLLAKQNFSLRFTTEVGYIFNEEFYVGALLSFSYSNP